MAVVDDVNNICFSFSAANKIFIRSVMNKFYIFLMQKKKENSLIFIFILNNTIKLLLSTSICVSTHKTELMHFIAFRYKISVCLSHITLVISYLSMFICMSAESN